MEPVFSACGIYCQLCPLYREKQVCGGCTERNQWYIPPCRIFTCAQEKGLRCCFECKEFPCEIHYKEVKIYTEEALNEWKKLIEKPKEWFIEIKERHMKKRKNLNERHEF